MPGQSAHTIKKGKTSKISKIRKDGNSKVAEAVLRGEYEDAQFGLVLKHLGDSRIRVMTPDKKEFTAVIRGLLRKRGVTPINTSDLVILSMRDYESRADSKECRYDVVAVLSRRDAEKLKKENIVPDWMAVGSAVGAGEKDEKDGFEFDHLEEDNEEVDIDDI